VTPDPRLVEAMAEALCDCRPTPTESGPCRYHQREAVEGLPAFLADPRTHEWLAERPEAEIARLRAIEEAARTLEAIYQSAGWFVDSMNPEMYAPLEALGHALRGVEPGGVT